MGKITVTAAEGVRAQVRVQKLETITREIPEVRNSAGELIAPPRTETFSTFADTNIVTFASEAREFEVGSGQRILVEEQA